MFNAYTAYMSDTKNLQQRRGKDYYIIWVLCAWCFPLSLEIFPFFWSEAKLFIHKIQFAPFWVEMLFEENMKPPLSVMTTSERDMSKPKHVQFAVKTRNPTQNRYFTKVKGESSKSVIFPGLT